MNAYLYTSGSNKATDTKTKKMALRTEKERRVKEEAKKLLAADENRDFDEICDELIKKYSSMNPEDVCYCVECAAEELED